MVTVFGAAEVAPVGLAGAAAAGSAGAKEMTSAPASTPASFDTERRDPVRPWEVLIGRRPILRQRRYQTTLPPLRTYTRTAAALPADLLVELAALGKRIAPPRCVRVPLRIDPLLERLPWEALLTIGALAAGERGRVPFDFWRQGEPLKDALAGAPRRPW